MPHVVTSLTSLLLLPALTLAGTNAAGKAFLAANADKPRLTEEEKVRSGARKANATARAGAIAAIVIAPMSPESGLL